MSEAQSLSPESISQDIIEKLSFKHLGQKPYQIERIIKGETNLVFKLSCESSNFFLRIAKTNDVDFTGEVLAMDKATVHGVLVAEVVAVDFFNFEKGNFQYTIQAEIAGLTLETFYNTNELNLEYVTEAGRTLSLIHKVPMDFCGKVARKDSERFTNYYDLLMKKFVDRPEVMKLVIGEIAGKNKQEVEFVKTIFDEFSSLFAEDKNILSHKDFGPEHIFINEGSISGIIDWGECGGFTPIHDFAWWEYFFAEKYPLHTLKEGYQNKALFDHNFETKLKLVELNYAFDFIWWYDHVGNKEEVEINVKKLNDLISYFQK